MTSIAIFGGSFDPITLGHIAIIKTMLYHYDQVWIMPCYNSLYDKQLSDGIMRIDMCKIALNDLQNVYVCDYEIRNQIIGSTFEILNNVLIPSYPDYDFTFIIGMDNANKIKSWLRWKELINTVKFVVVSRFGYNFPDYDDAWFLLHPHKYIHISKTWYQNISSTEFKNNYNEHTTFKSVSKYIMFGVYRYICQNGLYI